MISSPPAAELPQNMRPMASWTQISMSAANSLGFDEEQLRDSANFCIWIEIKMRWPIPLSGDRGPAGSLGG